jgi:hypothetical protein
MPLPLYPRERAPVAHWIGGWVDPRTGLDDLENRKFFTLPGLELRPVGRPARSQSLYRLRYPGSTNNNNNEDKSILHRYYLISFIQIVKSRRIVRERHAARMGLLKVYAQYFSLKILRKLMTWGNPVRHCTIT